NSKPDETQRPGNDDPAAVSKSQSHWGANGHRAHSIRQATGMESRDCDDPEGSATDLKGNGSAGKCWIAVLKLA
ncbi:hypothetical protein, partial [Staphylococcus aureus]|uniref:hypothetical protein n=1 Tax=Staphylococcus aureus TaxID=1280 RepID=UPI001F4440CE